MVRSRRRWRLEARTTVVPGSFEQLSRRPAPTGVPEGLRAQRREALTRPGALHAADLAPVDADDIVGIDLVAQPRRGRRSGLGDEDGAVGGEVVRRALAREGLVIVTGEKQLDAGFGNRVEGVPGASDDAPVGRV